MATIVTRQTTAAGATNNNGPLSNAQLDANFINLNNALPMTVGSAGAVATDQQYTYTMGTTILTTAWTDVGISAGAQLTSGVYMVYIQASAGGEFYTGLVPWYSANGNATLNNDFSEIPLIKTGDGGTYTRIYLRILRTASAAPKLQISANATLATYAYVLNFRRIW